MSGQGIVVGVEGECQRARENRNAKRVGNQGLNVCRGEWRGEEREKDSSVNETEGKWEVNGDTREENQGIKEGWSERAREKLLSSSQVVIRPRFVFT